jgi:hypothetical protein
LRKRLDDVLKVLNGGRNGKEAYISGGLGDSFERVFVFVKEYLVVVLNG